MDINEFLKGQDELLYGTKRNNKKFFKKLSEIQKNHPIFFKSDINKNKDITYYVCPNRPFENSKAVFLGFNDNPELPSEIKMEIKELWDSLFK